MHSRVLAGLGAHAVVPRCPEASASASQDCSWALQVFINNRGPTNTSLEIPFESRKRNRQRGREGREKMMEKEGEMRSDGLIKEEQGG